MFCFFYWKFILYVLLTIVQTRKLSIINSIHSVFTGPQFYVDRVLVRISAYCKRIATPKNFQITKESRAIKNFYNYVPKKTVLPNELFDFARRFGNLAKSQLLAVTRTKNHALKENQANQWSSGWYVCYLEVDLGFYLVMSNQRA